MDTADNAITKPVHRLEVFTGAVAGGRLVMKTRPGLSPRSRRAENRCVPWLDVTDYRHSSCLAGDVGCENLRLGLLRRMDCSLCPRWWMLPHRHLPLAVNATSRRARRSLVPERSRSRLMA